MLQKIREKITGWVAGTILAMLAVVFAVWGIDFTFTPRSVAARVNGDEVPVEPVMRAFQDQLSRFQQSFRQDVPEALQQEIRRSVIDQFVRRTLLEQRIRAAGYRVGDEDLAAQVRTIEAFQVGGQFNADAYRAALAGAGYSVSAFESDQRRLLEIQQLQDGIARSSFVTKDEMARRIALQDETRDVEWVSLTTADFIDQVEVAEADVAARYGESPERWLTQESADIAYLELKIEDLAADVQLAEEDIEAFYESEKAREPQRFSAPERRRASHILLTIEGDTDEAVVRQEAEALKARIDAGEDFAAVAGEASDDPGSAGQGGDLGWVEPGMMVPAFDQALFAIGEEGEVVGPVRSEFGFHLIRLDELEPGHSRTLEEVRDELVAEMSRRRAEDRFYQIADDMARFTFENPGTLEPAAEALGLDVKTLEKVTRASGGTTIVAEAPVQEAIWSEAVLDSGENSALIEIADGHAVVVRVNAHHPAETRPLEEVAETIEGQLRQERALAKARELAAGARAQLEAGESIDQVAGQIGGDFVAGVSVGREDASVPPAVVRAAFEAARPSEAGSTVATGEGANALYIVRVNAYTPGDYEALSASEQLELRRNLAQAQAGEELTAYLEQLRSTAQVSVFEQTLQ